MLVAKPTNIQRFRIIVVVSVSFQRAADLARTPYQLAGFYRRVNHSLGPIFFSIAIHVVNCMLCVSALSRVNVKQYLKSLENYQKASWIFLTPPPPFSHLDLGMSEYRSRGVESYILIHVSACS
jgi:hypothetical protein